MRNPKLIENKRVVLSDILRNNAPFHKHLSIATGYWDLAGTMEFLKEVSSYESIRLLIGQEPLSDRKQKSLKLDINNPEDLFPDTYFMNDLETTASEKSEIVGELRETAKLLSELIKKEILKVKVFRKPRLHAKAYIFGNEADAGAIGIIGSSNLTKAGLTSSAELNSLEDQPPMVVYTPQSTEMPHTHLSWFNELWYSEEAIEWTGDFQDIIENSPLGALTFGPYDVYIKTLMEVYPDELEPPQVLEQDTSDVLYTFQNRNAGILINKLNKMGVAILSDSVGLGKTITAGAVIKHYHDSGRRNIQVIAPAAIKQQWIDDLDKVLKLNNKEGAFDIISQQDINAIQSVIDYYNKEWRRVKKIDLFVIDEAHNLRSKSGIRHDKILELIQQHPESHILLLTATPINNSLMDIANQIQLAAKGRRTSVNVPYVRPSDKRIEMIDFFDALSRIQTYVKKAEKKGEQFDYEKVRPTIHAGLRHYLVRLTRQGVENEGGIINKKGNVKMFPKSVVESIDYKFETPIIEYVFEQIEMNKENVFESIDPREINLNLVSEFTQQTMHPLDFIPLVSSSVEDLIKRFDLEDNINEALGNLLNDNKTKSLIPNILQMIFMLGFTPYRPEIYNYKYYGKTVNDIRALEQNMQLGIQLTVHNILQITWLKRLESSTYALEVSIRNYVKRIALFEKYLDKGYIISLGDASLLESDYDGGEDIEQAFREYDNYLKEKEEKLNSNEDVKNLKKQGIERKNADPKIYNIEQLYKDIKRDKIISAFLLSLLNEANKIHHNSKMQRLAKGIIKEIKNNHGEKVLVFSFFADTINYLRKNLPTVIKSYIPDFDSKSEFITGASKNIESIVGRFSPNSKNYMLKKNEEELDYLFTTDILSEGQNLQDAGILINYDLHWNPVRMIQRNGRINRLGSSFNEVLIVNMKPTEEIEMYLKLVNRLQNKISVIKNTIGLDQGVLDINDVNPIEFIERYYKKGELKELDDDFLAYTDEHVLSLRKFIAFEDKKHIDFVKNMPKGKWNYLPISKNKNNYTISLVRTFGKTSETSKKLVDIFFVEVECRNEYTATLIEYGKALDIIKTDSKDNDRIFDNIQIDRIKVLRRAEVEAKRQAENPDSVYSLKPKMLEALRILKPYYNDAKIDLQGVIEKGTNNTKISSELEKIFRAVNDEVKKNGSPLVTTISQFEKLFSEIQKNVVEEKIIENTEGVLFYASK